MEEADGHFFVSDVVRGQWSAGNRDKEMKATAMADGPGVVQVIEQEGGTHGPDRVRQIVVSMAGVPVETVRPWASKPYRAEAFASQLQVGNVSCVKGKPWVSEYMDELAGFPVGKHDDQVDATALRLQPAGEPTRHQHVRHAGGSPRTRGGTGNCSGPHRVIAW